MPLWKVLGFLVIMAIVCLALWYIPKWQVADLADGAKGGGAADSKTADGPAKGVTKADRFAAENEARRTLAEIIGGGTLLVGLWFAWRRITTTERRIEIEHNAQVTERLSHAVQQLTENQDLTARLGAIFSLERVAHESSADYATVMQILAAFVRTATPWKPNGEEQGSPPPEEIPPLREDVQTILTVIGRRQHIYEKTGEVPLDLGKADLRKADLTDGHFEWVDLTGAHLEHARLVGTRAWFLTQAHLEHAWLERARLQHADCSWANLTDAWGERAHLEKASLHCANMKSARLTYAHMNGADLYGAKLTEADLKWSDLSFAKPIYADLQKADLYQAKLFCTNFSEARLQDAKLEEANCFCAYLSGTNLQGANLRKANLTEANLQMANLRGADLREARLRKARLPNTDLRDAQLQGADLKGIKVWQRISEIRGANLTGARHMPWGFREWAVERGAIIEGSSPDVASGC
jgi:uncharacterized protein YjbI with pentapeptide repeats